MRGRTSGPSSRGAVRRLEDSHRQGKGTEHHRTPDGKLDVFEFGRELLRTNDLDPVYVVLDGAGLDDPTLRRWLIAYWCFYHVGTASWIVGGDYWDRMETAAGSKEYPRCHERRHFRGENARKSVAYLKSRGSAALFDDLERAGPTAADVMKVVQTWVGFGPWIAFKVADMLERLGIARVEFDVATAMYESPLNGAKLLNEFWGEGEYDPPHEAGVGEWAVREILEQLGEVPAPPGYDRPINVQEVETILCKWKSYMNGHYKIGEDVEATKTGLMRFPRCRVSQLLYAAGRRAKLWP